MWNYVSSYLVAAPVEEPVKNEEKQLNSYTENTTLETSGPDGKVKDNASAAPTGFMNKIYTKMSGHPSCEIVLRFNPNRKYFTAGDDLIGKVCLKTRVEG